MTKINLIGMSVATAALLVSGCGSSSSSSSASGDDVINSLKQPIEMTDQNVTNVLALLEDQFRGFGRINTKVAKLQANLKKVQEPQYALAPGEPQVSDCDISGTETYTYTESDSGWTDEWVWDNCVNTGSYGSVDGVDLNRETRNGTRSYSYLEGYDADSNTSRDSYSGADNYTQVQDNNETEVVSRTYTYQQTGEYRTESSGEMPYYMLDPETEGAFVKRTFIADGISMREDVNASGAYAGGWKDVFENFSESEEELIDESAGTLTLNGGMTFYEDGVAYEGEYFDNYVLDWTRMNNEKTIVINGTAGTLCFGGSVSVTTTSTMMENQVDYFDGVGSTGSDVLPYAGGVNLSGADSVTATVGFATDEGNNTSATVTIGTNEPTEYTSWSALTEGSTCSILR